MIFVTTGSLFPFDRLIRAMDDWAGAQTPGSEGPEEILAQIGNSDYMPRHMKSIVRLSRPDYAEAVARARLVVAHAGVGSVISAGEAGKPIVVLPRRAHLNEHTSDHQVETSAWLAEKPGIYVAETEAALPASIARALAEGAGSSVSSQASPALVRGIRDFIFSDTQRRAPGPDQSEPGSD